MNGDEWVDSINNPESNKGIFSSYEIDPKPIGIGGFSRVYKVKKNGKSYAMKIPSFIQINDDVTVSIDSSALDNFKNEAINWSLISEKAPNSVVCLIDFNVDPFPWMVMELAEDNLKDCIASGKATVQDVAEALDCLQDIHSAGIIHRDIKPENILKVNGKWKLSDFGLSKIMGSMSTSTSGLKGTPQYMAPEQVSKKTFGDIDARTDVWQMGIILYEVLMGKPPYSAEDYVDIGMAIVWDGPKFKDAPEQFIPILSKALSKEKEERYSSAAEFASELRAVIGGSDVSKPVTKKHKSPVKKNKPKTSPSDKSSSWIKKPYVLVALTALIVVAVIVGGSTLINDNENDYHKLSYNLDGGTGHIDTQSVKEGDTFIAASYSGTKTGYEFTGWKFDSEVYEPGEEVVMPSYDMTLWAIWIADKHKVTYDLDGGSGTIPSRTYNYGERFTLDYYSGEKKGYNFAGWSYQGNSYEPGTEMIMADSDMVFKAIWEEGVYHTVAYDLDGGSGTVYPQTVMEGKNFDLQNYHGGKDGYTFGGWMYQGDIYEPGTRMTMGTSDMVFRAVWNEGETHTVTYDLDGGSGNIPSQSVLEGKTFTLQYYAGEKSGFSFDGWSYKGTKYEPGTTMTMGDSDMIIRAIWIAD